MRGQTSSNADSADAGTQCPICLHRYRKDEVNLHHLVPKSRKGKVTVILCRNCHRQIHALFTEKELERHYASIDLLLAAEKMQSWIEWARKRKPHGRVTTKTSKRKRK